MVTTHEKINLFSTKFQGPRVTPSKKKPRVTKANIKETVYFCSKCFDTFPNYQELTVHDVSCRKPKPKRLFSCKYCDRTFASSSNLRDHIARHEQVPEHFCNLCGKVFSSAESKDVHVRELHTDYFDAAPDGLIECKFCKVRMRLKADMIRHVKVHLRKVKLLCDVCGICYDSDRRLAKHKVEVHGDKSLFRCRECAVSFKSQQALDSHLSMVHAMRVFICELCGETFPEKQKLDNHRFVHSAQEGVECQICGGKYMKSGIVSHMRTHKNCQ